MKSRAPWPEAMVPVTNFTLKRCSAGRNLASSASSGLLAWRYFAAFFVLGGVLILSFSKTRVVQAATQSVGMGDASFISATITITAGDTVIWNNTNNRPHTVTADDGSFDSGNMNATVTFSRTFNSPGTFPYHCIYHGAPAGVGMAGRVMVQAAQSPPDASPPSQPANLAATVISASRIDLSWNVSSDNIGVTGYRLSRNGTVIATITATAYADSPVSPATTYNYSVVAHDAAGNFSTAATVSATTPALSDSTPPVISVVRVITIISNSAVISWQTDESATTQIEYGPTPALGQASAFDSTLVKNHLVILTGLLPNTTYHYRLKSQDAAGNLSVLASESPVNTPQSPTALPPSTSLNPTSPSTPTSPTSSSPAFSNPQVLLPAGTAIGDAIKFPDNPTVFLVKPEGLYPFDTFGSFKAYVRATNRGLRLVSGNLADFTIKAELARTLLNLPAFPTGVLVNDRGTIYLIRSQQKIPFTSMEAFLGLGYVLSEVMPGDVSSLPVVSGGYQLRNATQAHPWGSWVLHQGTIYYAHSTGLIGLPSWEIFLNNGGTVELILPINAADLAILQTHANLPNLELNDSRVFRD